MMSKTDQKRVEQFLKENDPDIKEMIYQERGVDDVTRAQLRRINEALVHQTPEKILDYLNSLSR